MKRRLLILSLLIFVTLAIGAQDKPDALKEYRAGNLERAVEICRLELATSPGNMDSHTVLGWSLMRLGRYQEVLEAGQAAFSQYRHDIRIIEVMGEANYFLGHNQDALKYFEEYCVLAPTGERIEIVYFYMGETFIRLGEYNHADIAFTTAVYHNSNTAKWWARLGYAREMAEDFQYALEAYEKALQLNSSLTDAVRGRERVEQKMGDA